LHES